MIKIFGKFLNTKQIKFSKIDYHKSINPWNHTGFYLKIFLISRASIKFLGLIDSKSKFMGSNYAWSPPTAWELICTEKSIMCIFTKRYPSTAFVSTVFDLLNSQEPLFFSLLVLKFFQATDQWAILDLDHQSISWMLSAKLTR